MSETKGEAFQGSCKWFNNEKGFGFLIAEGWNRDIFVHKQQLAKSKIDALTEGDKVIFVINEGKKGLFATDIVKVVDTHAL